MSTEDRIVVELWQFTETVTGIDKACALVVCAKTGVIYTTQAGGFGCDHPEAEGFAVSTFNFAPDIDDCEFGCSALTKSAPEFDKPELRKKFADAIDISIRERVKGYSFTVRFDYARIDELMEGWWPLWVKGNLNGTELDHPCYYHRGNCD